MYDVIDMKNKFSIHSELKNKKGFTLIELLVVISVIAVLTTLLMANFVGIRQRGRDGQRKSNLYNIQSALELYRADNGFYPVSFPACGEALTAPGDSSTVYMQELPCDPLDDEDYIYASSPSSCNNSSISCSTYTLIACLENEKDANADDVLDSNCATPASFTLNNP